MVIIGGTDLIARAFDETREALESKIIDFWYLF